MQRRASCIVTTSPTFSLQGVKVLCETERIFAPYRIASYFVPLHHPVLQGIACAGYFNELSSGFRTEPEPNGSHACCNPTAIRLLRSFYSFLWIPPTPSKISRPIPPLPLPSSAPHPKSATPRTSQRLALELPGTPNRRTIPDPGYSPSTSRSDC